MTPLQDAAASEARVVYQFNRLEMLDQWWHWLALLAVCALIVSYVLFWYRRDWAEIPKALGWTLFLLRFAALLGILFYFLDLEKRTEQKITRPSRVMVLIDTSLSMSLPLDVPQPNLTQPSRMEAVLASLSKERWLQQLSEKHETLVYRFDQPMRPQLLATFGKALAESSNPNGTATDTDRGLLAARWVARIGLVLALGAILAISLGMAARVAKQRQRQTPGESWAAYVTLGGVVGLLLAFILIATAVLRSSERPWKDLWWNPNGSTLPTTSTETTLANQEPTREPVWNELLTASGAETRLGDSIKAILEQERGRSLAGIVIVTDGQSNAGTEPLINVSDAVLSRVPIYCIGLGSVQDPANVRVVDVDAPKRVFPGDSFRVSGLIQASGLAGRTASVQLRRSPTGPSARFEIEEEQQVVLEPDETLTAVQFDVKPPAVGEWTYEIKVTPPPEDQSLQDNSLDTQVRVILPNSKVLIIAGGPTREYQFVRNLLFRDATVQSHVFLQTAGPGMAQEAKKLLDNFPRTLAEMSEYDCVLAFDADWMKLDVEQLETLERWVSQQAGGLVMVAGPVATPRWSGSEGNGDRRAEVLRGLAPVQINTRGMRLLSLGRFESETIWKLKFSDDGQRMDFLRIGPTPKQSAEAWDRFAGVYSYYACFDPKAGALPLLYFSDPATANDGKLPIYLASHFYGAGRVVFQGSGEMWRIREVDESYFDTYYTKLVRWTSQGRLLRDSDRGLLLLDKEEALVGEQIAIRALLKDNQFQPLVVPQVELKLIDPQQRSQSLNLAPLQDPAQPGVYVGQFLARQVGNYSVQLSLGGLADQEVLQQQVAIRMPTREIQRPQRNEDLLATLSRQTNGRYFTSLAEAMQPVEPPPATGPTSTLASSIQPIEQTNYLPGSPDRHFELRLMSVLMAWIAGCLSLEWLIRRLSKLA